MRETSLVDAVAHMLHRDPTVRSRVGDRVRFSQMVAELPDIVVLQVDGPNRAEVNRGIVLACRARTSLEADQIGTVVKTALKNNKLSDERWITVQDRSGYDSTSGAFRRVISVLPKSSK